MNADSFEYSGYWICSVFSVNTKKRKHLNTLATVSRLKISKAQNFRIAKKSGNIFSAYYYEVAVLFQCEFSS